MKTNIQTRKLIGDLNKSKVALWKRVASELGSSTRRMVAVNISKIDKVLREGEIALVPGKVLSLGELSKKHHIAAFSFSEAAKIKIEKAGGQAMLIEELFKKNPQGNKVRIMK